jgi:hypothetical protein
VLVAVKRGEVSGEGQSALAAMTVSRRSIRQPDRLTLFAPGHGALEHHNDRPPAKHGVAVIIVLL